MVQNLTILLNISENGDQENQSYEPLPTEEEIYQHISNSKSSQVHKEDTFDLQVQQPLAVIWVKEDGERYW